MNKFQQYIDCLSLQCKVRISIIYIKFLELFIKKILYI